MRKTVLSIILLLLFICFLVLSIFNTISLQAFQENCLKRLDSIEKKVIILENRQEINEIFDKQTIYNFKLIFRGFNILESRMFNLTYRVNVLSNNQERMTQNKRILKTLNR